MSSHTKQRDRQRGGSKGSRRTRNRKPRPKTFKTEEAAKKYAENKGIKNYELSNLKPHSKVKKIRVIAK